MFKMPENGKDVERMKGRKEADMGIVLKKREKKRAERQEEKRQEELMMELREVQKSLDRAYENFSYVIDPELIDCCIYELNAGQMRYKFLLKQMKESLRIERMQPK